jgi:quinol monooxygenase YgiN
MSAIRAIINVTAASPEAAEIELRDRIARCRKTEAEEPGCVQFEVFRSAMRPECYVVLEHWESEAAFDTHWKLNRSGTKAKALVTEGRTSQSEFYRYQVFRQIDGVYTPVDADPAKVDGPTTGIRWPSSSQEG